MKQDELGRIQRLVGPITEEQLRYVDCYIGNEVGVFMPSAGPCFFAISPEHVHPAYMFILPFDEETRMVVDGSTMMTSPGKIAALSPGIRHHEVFSGTTPRYIAVFIDDSFFNAQLKEYKIDSDHRFVNECYPPSPQLLPLLRLFMTEADGMGHGAEAVLHGLALGICHHIIRSVFEIPEQPDRIAERIEIGKTLEHIHIHLGRKLSVAELAGVAHMSVSYFTRVFKQETGETPLAYLKRVRMDRVKKLLMAGGKSITEIALECGFGSSAYLSASFGRMYGMTPTDYQNGFKEGRISKK